MLLALNPVFEQLRVGVENRPVGDQYVGLKAFRNPPHAVRCPDQFGGNLGQGGKGGRFRQSVAHARPHGASHARWAFESVRCQREFDARSVHPGGIGRRQFPVLQFIQPHEAAGVGVADVVRFGVIQGKHKRGSRCLEFIQALVCVVSGDQNERVVHVLTHLAARNPSSHPPASKNDGLERWLERLQDKLVSNRSFKRLASAYQFASKNVCFNNAVDPMRERGNPVTRFLPEAVVCRGLGLQQGAPRIFRQGDQCPCAANDAVLNVGNHGAETAFLVGAAVGLRFGRIEHISRACLWSYGFVPPEAPFLSLKSCGPRPQPSRWASGMA